MLLRRTYGTGIDDLWDALTSADRLGRWFLPVTGELRPGGRFQLEGDAGGEILDCAAPGRLRFSWSFGSEPGFSEVTLQLTPAGRDRTVLELVHEAVPTRAFRARYGPAVAGVGWDLALLRLARHLAGATLSPDAADAWQTSAEARAFVTGSGESWGAAYAASGAAEEAVASTTEATIAFYTGE
ncbi:SRPBCC domain-containing protein [Streptomyces sp. NPDC048018]|uniref:SRPBCC domain-containing protein n=1 Tax=Streptomyces sp. NPDC048018 TaxID=3365499 RepID=UPI003724BBD9